MMEYLSVLSTSKYTFRMVSKANIAVVCVTCDAMETGVNLATTRLQLHIFRTEETAYFACTSQSTTTGKCFTYFCPNKQQTKTENQYFNEKGILMGKQERTARVSFKPLMDDESLSFPTVKPSGC